MKTYLLTSLFLVSPFLCSAKSTVFISPTESEIQIYYQISAASCVNADDGTLLIEEVKGTDEPVVIFLDGYLEITLGQELTNLSYGEHKITIEQGNLLIFEEEFSIELANPLAYELTDRVKIFKGDSTTIDLVIYDDYDKIDWFLAPSISNRSIEQPIVFPERDQIYKAEILHDDVCITSVEVYVEVDPNRYVYFPTLFSPNGDGINDVFAPSFGTQVKSIRRFYVMDRWGRTIHQRRGFFESSFECQWDGRFGNKYVNAGVYTYFSEVEFKDGRIVKFEGAVTLMR